jgi:hypothetical protein
MFLTDVVDKIKTFILMFKNYLFPENRNVYKIIWKNIVDVRIWRMLITCWIPEDKNTHSEYVIRIAFPLQQWLLHERASMLRYTYIVCRV